MICIKPRQIQFLFLLFSFVIFVNDEAATAFDLLAENGLAFQNDLRKVDNFSVLLIGLMPK